MVSNAKPVSKQVLGTAPVCRPVSGMITVAAMMGGFFIIIEDPIFGGLAVSLIVGLFVALVSLTLGGLSGFDSETVYLSPAPLYHAAPAGWTTGTHRLGGTVVVNLEQPGR